MRIVHVIPGSGGGFYCQNCLRDNTLVAELRARGHDVTVLPMYLPMFSDETRTEGESPVFYGAISLYIKQRFPVLRRAPRLLHRLLDSRPLLKLAAGMAGSTRATGLEEMTLSMLRGEEGNQAEELDRLVAWLRGNGRPDVVHLSNALLLGLARRIRYEVGVPVVCSLQDEHTWVDQMGEPHAARIWSLMAERARDIAQFLPVSRYYAGLMAERMQTPPEQMQVVHLGVNCNGYESARIGDGPPAIGYLSRTSESLGLGVLVDAFLLLREDSRLRNLQLEITGGSTGDDRAFLRRLQRRVRRAGALDQVHLHPAFDRAERIRLLRSLSVLTVPVESGEAYGSYLLEAMASGVPVVQPAAGAFPELVALTGGGVVYEGTGPRALADALRPLLLDPEQARELGKRGREVVHRELTIGRMAERTVQVYERCLNG